MITFEPKLSAAQPGLEKWANVVDLPKLQPLGHLHVDAWSKTSPMLLEQLRQEARITALEATPEHRYTEAVRRTIERAFAPWHDAARAEQAAVRTEVAHLRAELAELREDLRSRPTVKGAVLLDLAGEGLELLQPVPVVIEEYEEEVVASWPEVETYGSGDTISEAITELKGEIASLYRDLVSSTDEQLGRLPRGWKRVLVCVVRETAAV